MNDKEQLSCDILPTSIEKKNTPTIQLQIMKAISAVFWGLLFFPKN